MKPTTKEKVKKSILILLIFSIIIGTPTYFYFTQSWDWNEYWQGRFESGQCEDICKMNNMTLSTEDPTSCGCIIEGLYEETFIGNETYYYPMVIYESREFTCDDCGKKFMGRKVVTVDYRSEKDCELNNEKHEKGEYHCKNCDIYNVE